MKTKLLFVSLMTTFLSQAQTPINTFYIDASDGFAVVTSNTPIDQTASGANLVWNFNDLVSIGDSNYFNSVPTATELSTFPNTNKVINRNAVADFVLSNSQFFTKDVANVVSITGLLSAGLELNFSTNNGTLGTFPMNYGFSNTDTVAGNYNYTTYSGTFTGNVVTTVDAYGLLTNNIAGGNNNPVTRLKTVITINLNYGFFTNIGTITQTTYSYYSTTNMLFRSSTTAALVPLASIDQTDTTLEVYIASLGLESSELETNSIQIAPNPVQNNLEIQSNETINIVSIRIVDMDGRTVFTRETTEKTIDVSTLQKGIYIATISANGKKATRKFIKI
jgi:Secretion system C-terminal sorting domain